MIEKHADGDLDILEIMNSKAMGKYSWYRDNNYSNGVYRDNIQIAAKSVSERNMFFNRDGEVIRASDLYWGSYTRLLGGKFW